MLDQLIKEEESLQMTGRHGTAEGNPYQNEEHLLDGESPVR